MQAVTSGTVARVLQSAIPKGEKGLFRSVSPVMEQVLRAAENLAQSDLPVLIVGEPGTGKQVLAEHIHRLSRKHPGTFVAVQGANPQWNDEAGNEIGSRRGTVYVRGVAAMDPTQQLKVLQLFFESNGSSRPAAARLIVSSEHNLEQEVRCGKVR